SSYIENPFVIAHEMTNNLAAHGLDGMLQGVYTFNPKWELMLRSGLNLNYNRREQRRPWDTANFPNGYYKQQDLFFMESNTDALLSYNTALDDDFSIRVSAGGNLMKYHSKEDVGVARGLTLPGIYKLSNAMTNALAENYLIEKEIQSVFGMVNLSWQDRIFVDVTGRNDWTSTLPSSNRSYFYPSVSSSFVLSELIPMPEQVSFAKLRLSWASVGTDTDPYRIYKFYRSSAFPGSAEPYNTLHNAQLKPEMTNSTEAGINVALFSNRLTANVNFQWNASINWAMNDNEILELSEGVLTPEQIVASSGSGAAQLIATVGGSTGDLWGYGLVRNEHGQVLIDPTTGLAVRPTDKVKIGNVYADWRGGIHNEFRYKNVSLSALIDGQYGGIVYSQTHHKMTEQGKLKHTLKGRETGTIVGEGVIDNGDGTYSPNTKEVPINTWYGDYYRRANVETNSFDASYLKLREVRLEIALPKSVVSR